jgi:trigger factor
MQVIELKNDGLDFHVKVSVSSSVIDTKIDGKLESIAPNLAVPGFRKGKVPMGIIRRKHGQVAREDVIKEQINECINQVVESNNLKVAGSPSLSEIVSQSDRDLEFVVKFELLPHITMPDFKKIEIIRPVFDVTEADLEKKMMDLAERHLSYEQESSGKSSRGDKVFINSVGRADGKEFEGGKLENYGVVLGSGSLIAGFEEQLTGVSKGDKLNIQVIFPKDYHFKPLAGKDAEFETEVVSIHLPNLPDVNEEFAVKLGYKSLQALKDDSETEIKNKGSESARYIMVMSLFNQLEKVLDFPVSQSMFERELHFLKETDSSGSDEVEVDSNQGQDYYNALAMRRVRIGLMLSDYAKLHNISVTQEDIKRAIWSKVRSSPAHASKILDYYTKNPKAVDSLVGPIVEEKAIDRIFESEVTLVDKHYAYSGLDSLVEEASHYDA